MTCVITYTFISEDDNFHQVFEVVDWTINQLNSYLHRVRFCVNLEEGLMNQVWWHFLAIPALRKLRQENARHCAQKHVGMGGKGSMNKAWRKPVGRSHSPGLVGVWKQIEGVGWSQIVWSSGSILLVVCYWRLDKSCCGQLVTRVTGRWAVEEGLKWQLDYVHCHTAVVWMFWKLHDNSRPTVDCCLA